jgi:selenocysteine-specific elongation factor
VHVLATAGHVDHGKSALVRALTGMEPDRWAEERRRGLTIDLGFAWTTLTAGEVVAFVDVPGHERFVTNMLAGVGPVPVVLLVVAADEGWMPQTAEHVQALDALGVEHGLLVVTKADLADPAPVIDDVRRRLRDTTLHSMDAVGVSSVTEAGLDDLRGALVRLVSAMPVPDSDAPVRLWVDRAFTIRGAGTVVTGTLTAGTISVGDRLHIAGADDDVVVRGIQSRSAEHSSIGPASRVALNLRGVDRSAVPRGTALVTPGQWLPVTTIDVTVDRPVDGDLVTHVGSAAVPTRVRRLGDQVARLRFARALPLQLGDRLLLREPARRSLVAATVADLEPAPLRRRGDAARVGAALQAGERWRPTARQAEPDAAQRVEVDLAVIAPLLERLGANAFAAPDRGELKGLDRGALAQASRGGFVLNLGAGVYVSPEAPKLAVERLRTLDQPFTVSAAGQALAASRRVVVPLLEHLDAARVTRRLEDGTRLLVTRGG